MIHEERCTYEVCLLAKEKGFPQAFNYNHFKSKWDYYNYKGELNGDVGDILKLRIKHKPIPEEMKPIAAPTQSLLQRWLREEKYLFVDIRMAFNGYYYQVIRTDKFDECIGAQIVEHFNGNKFDTYELALEDALKYILKNLV